MRVVIWLGSLDDAARTRDLPTLDVREHERARAFTDLGAAARFTALRRVQRLLAADALDVAPERLLSSYDCPECGPDGGHGRPGYRLTGDVRSAPGTTTPALALSATRAGGWGAVVVVADAPEGFRLGVDLTLEEEIFDGFDEVALNAAEKSWIASLPGGRRSAERAGLWAGKEAVAKRDGHGLRTDPARLEVLGRPGLVDLGTAAAQGAEPPPFRLMAAVPEGAEAAFRRAMA